MIRATPDLPGGVDILMNNAGIFPNIRFMSLTAADFDRVIAVNLRGVFLSSKAAAEQMISQGRGKIPMGGWEYRTTSAGLRSSWPAKCPRT